MIINSSYIPHSFIAETPKDDPLFFEQFDSVKNELKALKWHALFFEEDGASDNGAGNGGGGNNGDDGGGDQGGGDDGGGSSEGNGGNEGGMTGGGGYGSTSDSTNGGRGTAGEGASNAGGHTSGSEAGKGADESEDANTNDESSATTSGVAESQSNTQADEAQDDLDHGEDHIDSAMKMAYRKAIYHYKKSEYAAAAGYTVAGTLGILSPTSSATATSVVDDVRAGRVGSAAVNSVKTAMHLAIDFYAAPAVMGKLAPVAGKLGYGLTKSVNAATGLGVAGGILGTNAVTGGLHSGVNSIGATGVDPSPPDVSGNTANNGMDEGMDMGGGENEDRPSFAGAFGSIQKGEEVSSGSKNEVAKKATDFATYSTPTFALNSTYNRNTPSMAGLLA